MSIRILSPKRGARGFTLLELIVVIVILGILAALAIPTFQRVMDTSKLEVAEVTAAAVVRETIALSAFDGGEIITEDHIRAAVRDLPGQTAIAPGVFAAESVPYQVVFGKWEFSGNERTLSVIRGGTPQGSAIGAALYVPDIGCAFAKNDSSSVEAWSVMGLDPTSCNGAGAFMTPEELLELSAPPTPGGLEITFGCSTPDGTPGWNVTFDSGMVDVYVNGVYMGSYASGACIPGKPTDTLVVTPSDGAPGWEGGIGDVFDDGAIELPVEPPVVPETPVQSVPVLSDGTKPILIEWTTPPAADGVIVTREPVDGGPAAPVFTGPSVGSVPGPAESGAIYDPAPAGDYVYQVQPTVDGSPVGAPIPVTATPVATPPAVTSDGSNDNNGGKPSAFLVGDSVMLVWGEVADTRTAPLTGYRVYASVNGAPFTLTASTLKGVTFLKDGPLLPGTYCYRLSAYGPGGESGKSSEACVTLEAAGVGTQPGENKIEPAPAAVYEKTSRLGTAVAIDTNFMVIGLPEDNEKAAGAGAALVYARNSSGNWVFEDKIMASDGTSSDIFGSAVAVSGSTIVVGAYQDTPNGVSSGSVYTFEMTSDGWEQKSKFTASDIAAGDNFGSAVAISGNNIIVGSPLSNGKKTDSGSAYVFTKDPNGIWAESSPKLMASNGLTNDRFGAAVDIDGNRAAVGALGVDASASILNTGAGYIFENNGTSWAQSAQLSANDPAAYKVLGTSIALDGDSVILGAPSDKVSTVSGAGSAYVFTKLTPTTWPQQQKLTSSSPQSGALFGQSVDIKANSIIVGAKDDATAGVRSGSVYKFSRSGSVWAFKDKLTAHDATLGDGFGFSSSLSSSGAIIVGAPYGPNQTHKGATYLYQF